MSGKRVTLEEMLQRLKNKHGDKIIYISGFKGMRVKCMWKCSIDGHVWFATPNNVIDGGTRCPECAKKDAAKRKALPLDRMLERVKKIWGDDIIYVSGFVTVIKKCLWFCTKCGLLWYARPHDIMNKHGCPECAKKVIAEKKIIPLEEMLKRLKDLCGDDIEYVSGYVGMNTKCKFRCASCGHEWETTPNNLIFKKTGCPLCSKYSMESPVIKALQNKKIEFLHDTALEGSNYNGSPRPLRVDFIIETPKGKLAIETDGVQHFKEHRGGEIALKYQQEKDRYKDKYLKDHEYILIRVTSSPTKEWGFKNHITLAELLYLIEIGINTETKEINFDLFRQYDFNRD